LPLTLHVIPHHFLMLKSCFLRYCSWWCSFDTQVTIFPDWDWCFGIVCFLNKRGMVSSTYCLGAQGIPATYAVQ
jgi:hypothetical protein